MVAWLLAAGIVWLSLMAIAWGAFAVGFHGEGWLSLVVAGGLVAVGIRGLWQLVRMNRGPR